MKQRKYLFISYLLIFLVILYSMKQGWLVHIDERVYQFSQIFNSNFTTHIMKFITYFGGTAWLIIGFVIIFFFLRKNIDRLYFCLTMLTSEVLNLLLKNIIQRPRPNINQLVMETSFSFPSGHAMGSMTFYGLLIYFIWNSTHTMKRKILLRITLSILIFLICFSRIYLGVHYFSDILAGVVLSLFIIKLIRFILGKKFP